MAQLAEKTSLQQKFDHQLEIRPAAFADMAHVTKMISSTADWYRKFVSEKDMAEHEVGDDWARKNYAMRDFYVGHHQGRAVGTVSLQYFGDWAYLGYVYLDAKHVGNGFGRQLLEHAQETARRRGMKGMVLIAHPQAKWAKRAYLKYGFEIIRRDADAVTSWNNGALKPHYEQGFELYQYSFDRSTKKHAGQPPKKFTSAK